MNTGTKGNIPADSIDRAEWERRYKARIVSRLTAPMQPGEEVPEDFRPWTPESAERAADAEWTAVDFDDHAEFFENDPEGAADEEMSNWSE